jgi:hypothetical protein
VSFGLELAASGFAMPSQRRSTDVKPEAESVTVTDIRVRARRRERGDFIRGGRDF